MEEKIKKNNKQQKTAEKTIALGKGRER